MAQTHGALIQGRRLKMVKSLKQLGLLASATLFCWYVYSFLWVVPTQGGALIDILCGEFINASTLYVILGQIGLVAQPSWFKYKWLQKLFCNSWASTLVYRVFVLGLEWWYPYMFIFQDSKGMWGHTILFSAVDASTFVYILFIIANWFCIMVKDMVSK